MQKLHKRKFIKKIVIVLLMAVIFSVAYIYWFISLHKWQNATVLPTDNQKTFPLLTGTLLTSPFKSHEWVINLIKKAKYSIDIWWYEISDKAFINTLKQKALQWIKIRIILENSTYWTQSKEFTQFLKQIKDTAIEVKSDEHLGINFQHAKTIIIDNESFLVSSANFTYWWFFANREHWFIASEPYHTNRLVQQFTSDRENKKWDDTNYPSSLRICPYNCREELSALITHAQSEIIIQAQYLEDPLLINQLVEKLTSWITIRIIVGKYHDTTLPVQLQEKVRTMSDPNVHAKAILVDWAKLYLWSMNLSTNAVEKNREIGIVTTDTYSIHQFLDQFDKDRQSLTP